MNSFVNTPFVPWRFSTMFPGFSVAMCENKNNIGINNIKPLKEEPIILNKILSVEPNRDIAPRDGPKNNADIIIIP